MDSKNRTSGFYPSPYSLNSLTKGDTIGLAFIGSLATMSIVTLAIILTGITRRLIDRRHKSVNQCLVLIYNLLIADMLQALGFVTSFNWLRMGGIFAPTLACWVQGALINLGDVSSGFFVLSIAIHTFFSIVRGQRIPYRYFCCIIVAVWAISLVLSLTGPFMHGADFYTRAGNWCWISERYESKRLYFHYVWIFIDEFATVIIYAIIHAFLLRHLKVSRGSGAASASARRLRRVAKLMGIYPIVYVVLTLPLATARMMNLAGHENPNTYLLVSGALLTSCGLADSILYPITRPVLFASEEQSLPNHPISLRMPRGRDGQTPTGNSTIIRGGKDLEDMDIWSEENDPHHPPLPIRPKTPTSKARRASWFGYPSPPICPLEDGQMQVTRSTVVQVYKENVDELDADRSIARSVWGIPYEWLSKRT